MNTNLTEVVFILDRSGSMHGLEKDTIGGFNSTIEKQKKLDGECLISTVLFDDVSEVIYDRVPVSKIREMTEDDYTTRGCTALIDALGDAIHHISNVHKYAREEDRPAKTLFIITTDGLENASRRYSSDKVKKMVQEREKKYNWEFIFIGANIDAVETAKTYGIREENAANYNCDSIGTEILFCSVEQHISESRARPLIKHTGKKWKSAIESDYHNRKQGE